MLFGHKHYVFQRYYYYIRKGIGTEDVAAMEDSWLENVLALVPAHLKSLSRTIEAVSDEIREDYLMSIKKAIGTVFCLADLACRHSCIKYFGGLKLFHSIQIWCLV